MYKFDDIDIKNIRYLDPTSFLDHKTLDADVYVNNQKFSGFCDIETFFLDSHITEEHHDFFKRILHPKQNKIDFYLNDYKTVRKGEAILLDFNKSSKERLNSSSKLGRKSLLKKIKKERKNLILNPNYLKSRDRRIKLFNNYKYNYSFYYLNSCSCGIPSCNGYYDGVFIKKIKFKKSPDSFNRHCIRYTAPKNKGYEHSGILGSGKMSLLFHYSDILKIRKKINDFIKKKSTIVD